MDVSLGPLLGLGTSQVSLGPRPSNFWRDTQPVSPQCLPTQCLCGFQAVCGKAAAFCGKLIMLTSSPSRKNYQTCMCKSPDSANPRSGERQNGDRKSWNPERKNSPFNFHPSPFT